MGQLRLLGEPPTSDDHAALVNLAFAGAGHSGFVAAAGLAAGQTIIGGIAPGENLSLQSTAHASRGVLQVIDAMRLVSGLIQDSGGDARVALAAASPHLTLTGDLQLAPAAGQTVAHAAIAPAIPDAFTQLVLGGQFGELAGSWKGLVVSPQLTLPSGSGALQAVYGQATLIVPAGATALMQGLQFTAFVSGQGTISEMEAVWGRLASINGSTVTITKAATLYARSPIWWGAKPADLFGLYVEPHGNAGVNNAVGALIDAPAGGTNRYTLWAGAPITGTPRLRLDAGTPAANQTLLWLAEGATPTLRQVQWKLQASLLPTDRVMILV